MSATSSSFARPAAPVVSTRHVLGFLASFARFEIVVAVCTAALILVAIPRTMADPDIWWHLRNGFILLAHPAAIRHDTYSFTSAGSPWIDHEWLSELLFVAGWKLGGTTGVFAVTALLLELIFAGVFALAWRASRSAFTAALCTVGAALLATVSFGPRTLLTGWLCLVLQLLLVDSARRRPRLLLGLPVLYGFWVNLHGSWMIGLVVLALGTLVPLLPFAADARGSWRAASVSAEPLSPATKRMLLPAWIGVFAALFANPWSWRLVLYPFNFAFRQTLNVSNVEEWHALDWHSLRGRVVLAGAALVVARQLWRPRRWALREVAFLALGLYSAASYSRFTFLLGILAAAPVARSFRRGSTARALGQNPVLNAVLLVSVLGFAAGYLIRQPMQDEPLATDYPSEPALAALDRLPQDARVFNEYLWGGYLEWRRPRRPVFVDSRVDLFEYNGTFRDYLDTVHLQNAEPVLDRYRIDAVFFEPDTPLVLLLERSGAWQPVYSDAHTVLLARTHPLLPKPVADAAP